MPIPIAANNDLNKIISVAGMETSLPRMAEKPHRKTIK
jgi:hypothetical protein